jgi:hypothetical protein
MEVRSADLVMVRYGADEHAKATRAGDLRKASTLALIELHRRPLDDVERLETRQTVRYDVPTPDEPELPWTRP